MQVLGLRFRGLGLCTRATDVQVSRHEELIVQKASRFELMSKHLVQGQDKHLIYKHRQFLKAQYTFNKDSTLYLGNNGTIVY